MVDLDFTFEADIWLWAGKAAWHFITVPQDHSEEIRFFFKGKRGFGSVPVQVTIGETRWTTSIFPDKKSGCYFLPVKAEVRKKEKIAAGDTVTVRLKAEADFGL